MVSQHDDQDTFDIDDDGLMFDDDDSFGVEEDQTSKANKLDIADVIKNNPAIKIFGVVAVVVGGLGYLMLGGGDGGNTPPSVVSPGSQVSAAGGVEGGVTPAYEQAIREQSQRRADAAEQQGGSALPTLISRPEERLEAPVELLEDDPLAEWRQDSGNLTDQRRLERERDLIARGIFGDDETGFMDPEELRRQQEEEARRREEEMASMREQLLAELMANGVNENAVSQMQQMSSGPTGANRQNVPVTIQVPQTDPVLQNEATLAALNTGITPEKAAQIRGQFGTQMGVILQSRTPKASVVQATGLSRPFDINQLNNPNGGVQMAPVGSVGMPQNATSNLSQLGNNNFDDPFETRVPEEMAPDLANQIQGTGIPDIFINAGDIAYAQVITEANSDVPGPVLARVLSGPLAGARMIGQFTVSEEYMVVTFTMAVKDNIEYPINAMAINPDTTLPAVASDVDHHYFARVFLPAAARFVEGFAEAVADQGGTTVTVDGETVTEENNDLDTEEELLAGLEEAATLVSDELERDANRPITVKLERGTPIGLLFLERVEPGA